MKSGHKTFVLSLVIVVIAVLLTSGIWLAAYFIKIKPNGSCPKGEEQSQETADAGPSCNHACSYEIVESMPEGLFEGDNVLRFNSTADSWKRLMSMAEKDVYLTSFYWSLLAIDTGDGFTWDDSAITGQEIYEQLTGLAKKGIKIRINQDTSRSANNYPYNETKHLAELGAEVYSLNFTKLLGGGVLHTKSWIIDDKHLYIGSANHDWRSLTQVKEIGITIYDCPCLASDLKKIFEAYTEIGRSGEKIPDKWSNKYATRFNSRNPMEIQLNNEDLSVYFTSSPPEFVPNGREHDGRSIIRVIDAADKFIYISVMDYAPATLYARPNYYWPYIDDAIRHAAFDRRVHVRLLMSKWQSTRPQLFSFLHSLRVLNSQLPSIRFYNATAKKYEYSKGSIEIKIFEVPPYKVKIPFARGESLHEEDIYLFT